MILRRIQADPVLVLYLANLGVVLPLLIHILGVTRHHLHFCSARCGLAGIQTNAVVIFNLRERHGQRAGGDGGV